MTKFGIKIDEQFQAAKTAALNTPIEHIDELSYWAGEMDAFNALKTMFSEKTDTSVDLNTYLARRIEEIKYMECIGPEDITHHSGMLAALNRAKTDYNQLWYEEEVTRVE